MSRGGSPIKKKTLQLIILITSMVMVAIAALGYFVIPQGMWNFLIVDEQPRPADAIIILSGGTDRVEHGVSLFQAGYADKIILSGSVARNMSKQVKALGVTADHILLEERSHTTNQNAIYSLQIMQSQGYKSAIVVTSPYHTRRSELIFRHQFKGLDVTISAAPYDPSLARNWWKDRKLAGAVIREYLKLVYHFLFER
jgi:uncharacterized SAM-binding protein YcdF (DUF218 family)